MRTESNEPAPPHGYRIFPALIVIAIGVIFLIRNLGIEMPFFDSPNWWAWLILVAAVAPLSQAYEIWRARGRVDSAVIHSLLRGVAVALVAMMFLLGLDWKVWWPLFLILGGLFTLVSDSGRRSSGDRNNEFNS